MPGLCFHIFGLDVKVRADRSRFQFYLGDLEDELTIAALRMLVMDLLILFQAGNEGVINVLGHRCPFPLTLC